MDLAEDGKLHALADVMNTAFTCVELEPSEDNLFAVHEENKQHKQSIEISLSKWNSNSLQIIKKHTLPGRDLTAVAENIGNGTIAIARMGRLVDVINIITLDIMWTFYAEGSGIIKSFMYLGDGLSLIPSDNRKLTLWNNDKKVRDFLSPYGSIYYLAAAHVENHHPSRVWLSNEAGLYNLALDWEVQSNEPEMLQIAYHHTTCCGVDCHQDMVASGDFAGNVFLWKKHKNHPIALSEVFHWRPDSTSIQIGTMDGKIRNWQLHQKTSSLQLMQSLEGGITCIKWQHLLNSIDPHKGAMLASGTTEGINSNGET